MNLYIPPETSDYRTIIGILSAVEYESGSGEKFSGLEQRIKEFLTQKLKHRYYPYKSLFCLLSSGGELALGRNGREEIRNSIYHMAAKYDGIILTNGENCGLAQEIGFGKDRMSHIYDDKVPILGLTDNQNILKLSPDVIEHHHDGIICSMESVKVRVFNQNP